MRPERTGAVITEDATAATTSSLPDGEGGAATGARPHRARRGEGEQLRDEILDATQALLDETGDEAKISIRRVAERVGRTSPSIYLHFPDKDSLMFAVCQRQYQSSEDAMVAAAAGVEDPVERMVALARAFVHWGLDNPEQFRILFLTDRSSALRSVGLDQVATSGAFVAILAALGDAQRAGAVELDDSMAVLLDLWAAVQGITTLLITRPDFGLPDADAWIDHLLGLILDGLRPR